MRKIYIGLAAVLMAAADTGGGAAAPAATTKAQDAAAKKPFEDEILAAIAKLKHDVDTDWNEDGRPSMKRIVELAGNTAIKRENVDEVAPDVKRDVLKAKADPLSAETLKADAKEGDEEEGDLDTVRVRAIRKGYYGGKIREPGEDFTYSGPKPSWIVVLKD